jgi:hypothetical protein
MLSAKSLLTRGRSARGVSVTHDIDCTAIGQKVVEFRIFGEFVDPREVDKKQPARILGRGVEAIKIHRLAL